MQRPIKAVLLSALLVWAGRAQAEYCLDWSSVVRKYSGSSGHCWASEQECDSYRFSRPAGDYSGGCYYRPGQYPPTGGQKGGGKASGANAAAAKAAAEQKKNDAMKRQQAEAERQAFEKDRQQLLGTLKGGGAAESANTIVLKPLPPAGGQARSQLDCAARNKPEEGWEKRATDCTPVTPGVPEPPKPTEVPSPADPASLAKLLEGLGQRISASRESLVKRDSEIAAREREIAREEQKAAASSKPAGESDALRRARAALEKAKADRARTAAELAKLEQQESAARNKASLPAQ